MKENLIEFKNRALALAILGQDLDKQYLENKINKKKKKEIEKKLIYEWHKTWNKHPDVPDSIKQAFNLLYT
jgi:hypothetical protein